MTMAVRLIESLSTFSPLGIRFWDPVQDRQIRDGLQVTAWPAGRPHAVRQASRTFGDVYGFGPLPGLRAVEYGFQSAAAASPPAPHPFVVRIEDTAGRFLSAAFAVDLPLSYAGVYLSGATGSPVQATPRGLHLYSTATRPLPPGAAAVRGELRNAQTGEAAAHALIEVRTESGDSWYGVADRNGQFVVVMPYPVLRDGFGGSPASAGHLPLMQQVWHLTLGVRYQPAAQPQLPGTGIPDYLGVLQQADAELYEFAPADGGVPVPSLPVELRVDRHPTVRTEGFSHLLVNPGSTSP